MKKVLIALDYDPTAQKVVEQGFALAESMNAEVVLLHVVANQTYYANLNYSGIMGFYGNDLYALTSKESLIKTVLQFLDKTKEHLGDNNIEILAAEGDFPDIIMDVAKMHKADIIVLGSHSKRWLEKILMGSVTEKVLRESTLPLFIIPTKK